MKKVLATALLILAMGVGAFACDSSYPQGIHGRNIKVYVNNFSTTYESKVNGSEEGRKSMQVVLVKALNFVEQDAKSPDTFIEAKDVRDANIIVNVFVTDAKSGSGYVYQTEIKTFGKDKTGAIKEGTIFTAEGDPFGDPVKAILSAYYTEGQYFIHGWTCEEGGK